MQRVALFGVLAVALALRLWGVGDRLPDPTLGIDPLDDSAIEETDRTTMGLAWGMWGGGARHVDLNPRTGGWPGLSFYAALGTQILYRGYWQLRSSHHSTSEFLEHVQSSPAGIFLFGRIAGVLTGVLTVWLAFRVAHTTLSWWPALLAACLLAVNPVHILTSQHISDPNLLALLFVLLATLFMVRIGPGTAMKPSVFGGALIGLAGACKYAPLAVALPFLWVHYAWARSAPSERGAALKGSLLGVVAMAGAFFAASPFLLLDYSQALGSVQGQLSDIFGEWTGQSPSPVALPTYLLQTVPDSIGWPALVLCAGGMVILARRTPPAAVIVLIPASLVLVYGMLRVAQQRHILPAVPFLLTGTVVAIEWLHGILSRSRLAPGRVAIVLALVGWIVIPALGRTISVRQANALPDSRHVARRWLNQHVHPALPIVVESYGPVVNSGRTERLAVSWPFYAVGPSLVRPAYHSEFLDGFRLYVASGEVSRRYLSDPGRYPVESQYYRWLSRHSAVEWHSDSARASGPRIEVRRLPDRISTPEARERAWRSGASQAIDSTRVGRWCLDLSRMFLLMEDYPHAAEWARRGRDVATGPDRVEVLRCLAMACLNAGAPAIAEHATREAIALAPHDAALHLYRGMSLSQMGLAREASAEYEESLRLSPRQEGWALLQEEIDRLRKEAGTSDRRGNR